MSKNVRRVLNIGCGLDTYGTDRIDKCESPAVTMVCDVEQGLPYPNASFDEVYSKNNLEHLRNVGFHLQEIHRVLKRGGRLKLITDNASCIRFYLFGTHTGRYEKLHEGDCHYSVFTVNHLKNHLKAACFTDVKFSYVETDTKGRFLDWLTRLVFRSLSYPRIRVEARK